MVHADDIPVQTLVTILQ